MENTENETPKKEICVNPNVSRMCRDCGCPLNPNEYGICDECDEDTGGETREDYEERIREERQEELFERAAACTCGAWVAKDWEVYHVADCCCGAE